MRVTIVLLCFWMVFFKGSSSQPIRITNFEDLIESLNSGSHVKVVIHYSQCNWKDSINLAPLPDATAGLTIDTYEYFAKEAIRNKNAFIVFSSSKLIQNPKGKGFVYNYGKVRINEDNTVEITAKYIHPKTFKVLMDEVFAGKLNDGKNDGGISLFK